MSSGFLQERWKEIAGVLIVALGLYLFLSIVSFRLEDIPFHSSRIFHPIHNWAGPVGAYIAFLTYFIFGINSFFIPLIVVSDGIILLRKKRPNLISLFGGTFLIFFSASFLFALVRINTSRLGYLPGGIVGAIFTQKFSPYFGEPGSYIITLTLLALGLLLATDFSLIKIASSLKLLTSKINVTKASQAIARVGLKEKPLQLAKLRENIPLSPEKAVPRLVRQEAADEKDLRVEFPKPEPGPVIITKHVTDIPLVKEFKRESNFSLPSLSLLNDVSQEASEPDSVIMVKAKELEQTLAHFDIEAKVVEIHQGPVITSFELEPAQGVKVHRITSLEDDIALGLKARSIRIIAPIPGKSAVGIEVPNDKAGIVSLKEVLSSRNYIDHPSKLKIALGKDILGEVVVADLGEMPHLLIAGTTGSGKTVCINALIASILFSSTPDEVRFLMVDPKMVELAYFDGLPHLLTPVVKEVRKLPPTLKWIIREMERRYELLAHVGSRNIDTYNRMNLTEIDISIKDPPQVLNSNGKMPYLVIIIDELADIMVVAQNQVEEAITRLAQLSRAVGIHMVLATQRPSVDVITGVIKANFPCRISFQVSSKVDSRTVLDMNGAETLLGKGDMLYLPANLSKPVRLQGAMVKDEETKRLVEFLTKDFEPEYYEDIFMTQGVAASFSEEKPDELYDEAVRILKESGRASVSYLQRRLKIGYTRAARIMDRMEEEGVVGPFQGSRVRAIMPEESAEKTNGERRDQT